MNNIGYADLKKLKELYPHNFKEALKKIQNNYPIQYLIGNVDFYNLTINVDERVLIPRFETELLVDLTIPYLKTKNYQTILDIGTGSGAIAIALKKNLALTIDACDISTEALTLAQENAQINSVKINFEQIDILKEIPSKKYDCIISNPPYVKEDEYTSPQTKYEPQIALYAKNNGLEFYERIINISQDILNKNGSIIFEIGATQAQAITQLVQKTYPQAHIIIKNDYNNYNRFMFIEILSN